MYRWIEHTSEVELRVDADAPEAVVREALTAVSELLGEADPEEPSVSESIDLEAGDRPALLAAWLEELAFLAETRGLICEDVLELELGEDRLRATMGARPGTPRHLVKSVTYHRLRFERSDAGWVATVVLDV